MILPACCPGRVGVTAGNYMYRQKVKVPAVPWATNDWCIRIDISCKLSIQFLEQLREFTLKMPVKTENVVCTSHLLHNAYIC